MSNMVKELTANYNETHLAQTQQFSALMAQQAEAMHTQSLAMEAQRLESLSLRAELKAVQSKRIEYTEAADGIEDWVINDILEEDLRETHRWWHVTRKRWENRHETVLRARIYYHLTTRLPKELYSQNAGGRCKSGLL